MQSPAYVPRHLHPKFEATMGSPIQQFTASTVRSIRLFGIALVAVLASFMLPAHSASASVKSYEYIAWTINAPATASHPFEVPQTNPIRVSSVYFTPECGLAQVDKYIISEGEQALVAGGTLSSPSQDGQFLDYGHGKPYSINDSGVSCTPTSTPPPSSTPPSSTPPPTSTPPATSTPPSSTPPASCIPNATPSPYKTPIDQPTPCGTKPTSVPPSSTSHSSSKPPASHTSHPTSTPSLTTSSHPATRLLASTGYGTHVTIWFGALLLALGLMFLGFDFCFGGVVTRKLRTIRRH